MFDFVMVNVNEKEKKDEVEIVISPKFIVNPECTDLMIRGGDFYAVWDEDTQLWSTKEHLVCTKIDAALQDMRDKYISRGGNSRVKVAWMWDSDSGSIDRFHKYVQRQMRDNWKPLDEQITFANTKTKKSDYISKRLPYALGKGDCSAYDRLMEVLYDENERRKLEWAIGAVINGDAKRIQKFIVLYGSAGSGKSTVLNIIQWLFPGYTTFFDAKDLTSSNAGFALEAFKGMPLVAIQHDGDLSRIEDNTRLNSIVSHETMEINAKYEKKYTMDFKAFLFLGTNRPVKITDAKSGIIRRLIDVTPSGRKIAFEEYQDLMYRIATFELGAIAQHCLTVYENLGMSYYDTYVAKDMISATNDFFDFIEEYYDEFKNAEYVTLAEAWAKYKKYCDFAKVKYPLQYRNVRYELRNYFREFHERKSIDGRQQRNVYEGFIKEKFQYDKSSQEPKATTCPTWLEFEEGESLFDSVFADCPAQYAKDDGTPRTYWANVKTKLKDLDTTREHYVMLPPEYATIDFDLKDKDGKKDLEKNIRESTKWPPTYAELSKSGQAIHLTYLYEGDVSQVSSIFSENVEVKSHPNGVALRRKRTKCVNLPIAKLPAGSLPLKEVGKTVNWEGVQNEKMLRTMIQKNLNKEYHGYTKPSIDFIAKLLDDAYQSGIDYDVRDMMQACYLFALRSSNNSAYCLDVVDKMKFASKNHEENEGGFFSEEGGALNPEEKLVFYDIEVLPNLLLVCWKYEDSDNLVSMINPTPDEIERFLKYALVGFNNRKYDNHILYARLMGYDNEAIYRLSKRIIDGDKDAFFGEAYNLSYADVYDFCSEKQSLKKWEIALGLPHQEFAMSFDEPLPEDKWPTLIKYCFNDVRATEAVFKARAEDFEARQILAELSGLTVNDTTRQHTTKIIFGGDRHPDLVYTHLEETFPGYEYVKFGEDNKPHNMYRGEDASFGGYVYAEPGVYTDVALIDVESMHPHSILAMNVFGEYTQRFADIVNARLAIKHHDYDTAKTLLDGALAPYLGDDEQADRLSQALKIVINSVYGYTSATFPNPFKDPRNVNNIVALRGALFMMTLRDEVKARGFKVAHIKTDSIKIPNATPEIIEFCKEFAKKYQYKFDHEATYSKMCLVNDAVYIAKYATEASCEELYGYVPSKNKKYPDKWTATGTQFQVPYVFKTLFSHEKLEFDDFCETKSVSKGALYLDMNVDLPDVSVAEAELTKLLKKMSKLTSDWRDSALAIEYQARKEELEEIIATGHNYVFVGRVGRFCPVKDIGGVLYRKADDKYYAATGTTGYRWLESTNVKTLGQENWIDQSYYKALADAARDEIDRRCREIGLDFDWFVNGDPKMASFMNIPDNVDADAMPFN